MSRIWKSQFKDHHVTDEALYLNRRQWMAGAAGLGLGAIAGPALAAPEGLEPNSYEDITNYNNYYEFGTDKSDPAKYAHTLTTSPWTVTIDGLVDKPGDYQLEDILAKAQIEERIYRLRCVEAWSMVIPWNGFTLASLLERVGVQSGAKYVAFETAARPEEMPGLRYPVLDWPYREGLRLDEAMHPLTLMATG
ncbi:MAG: protein-methionine-sulfoxide reductase catalytic subunit MsrP, partial [Pseudomonadota bacterium]|nr:protein-methionine-sulfoxide reductase catalytic subunit MsrP [Pseudomonadota bacterium]MEC9312537.1 protein-methionine-sulfoxide reductase catalytic subunit MsrP [Pseudomonadota bacterium]